MLPRNEMGPRACMLDVFPLDRKKHAGKEASTTRRQRTNRQGVTGQGMQSARREHAGELFLVHFQCLLLVLSSCQGKPARVRLPDKIQDTQLKVNSDKCVYLYYILTSHTCLKKLHLFAIQM